MAQSKFHGRFESEGRQCAVEGCCKPGEFRAPGYIASGFDGPGEWRWLCLEHVRSFNAGYNWFEGMSAEEISAAQSPIAGWQSESMAFSPTAGIDGQRGGRRVGLKRGMPRWTDFDDPLDAIGARAETIKQRARARREAGQAGVQSGAQFSMQSGAQSGVQGDSSSPRFSAREAQALEILGLGLDTDRRRLRQRYSELVRRYHPDRNGGDRQYEARLSQVVAAYQLLRRSPAFA